jgi:hypothetical protein
VNHFLSTFLRDTGKHTGFVIKSDMSTDKESDFHIQQRMIATLIAIPSLLSILFSVWTLFVPSHESNGIIMAPHSLPTFC